MGKAGMSVEREVAVAIDTAYAVAADVEAYPQFVPGFTRAVVIGTEAGRLIVRNEIGFGGAAAQFTSRARLAPPGEIEVESVSATFGMIRVGWHLTALGPHLTRVRFDLSADLRSSVAQVMFEAVARTASGRMLDAFIERARARERIGARPSPQTPSQETQG